MAPTPESFGFSLLVRDGDLVLESGRLVEVAGIDNLVQALTLRVLTPLGGDPFNVTYGFDVAAVMREAGGAQAVRDLVTLSLVRVVGTDPRVREVREVAFEPVDGSGRRAWTASVTVVVADGSQQVLAVTGGG